MEVADEADFGAGSEANNGSVRSDVAGNVKTDHVVAGEGDTLVVDTIGYNDRSWLPTTIPHTEKRYSKSLGSFAWPGLLRPAKRS